MKRFALLAIVIAIVFVPGTHILAKSPPRKHALLVGCTRYESSQINSLEGPANDVLLLRDVLKRLYGFTDENVTILSEEAGKSKGADYRPTRANIEREFVKMATKVKKGDKVVILLAGHGSQQPDSRPDDPERFEPDGKEEIFLPADTGDWDGANRVKNAIVDYEFRDWLKAIRKTGASIWVIVDACHSASMIRGTEVPREVPAEKLVPKDVLRQAEEKAQKRLRGSGPGTAKKDRSFKLPPDEPDLVALYAAQSTEPTVEKLLPEEGTDRKPRGLLTYTLCKTLVEASEAISPLTYQELLQRIHEQYRAWGRSYPTPLVEGKDANREVFGEKERKARFQFRLLSAVKDSGETRTLDAGALHGLTAGSILRVFPLAGGKDATKPLGHVRVSANGLTALQSQVEPIEHAGMPAPKLVSGQEARCELVHVEFGDQRLAIAVDERTNRGENTTEDRRQPLLAKLTELARGEDSLLEVAPSAPAAQWLLRYDSLASGKLYLVPAAGWVLPRETKTAKAAEKISDLPSQYGPVPAGKELAPWLQDHLGRIARVRNLLALTTRAERFRRQGNKELGVRFKVELVRFRNDTDEQGIAVAPGPQGITLHDQDPIGIRVLNEGREPIDVTLLLLSNDYSIQPIFPKAVTVDNRILPNKPLELGVTMGSKTAGLEHLIVIAAKGKALAQYANFSFLAQPGLQDATQALSRSAPGTQKLSFDSPLGRLFRKAAYGEGKARAMATAEVSDYAFQVVSYEMSPRKRPVEKK